MPAEGFAARAPAPAERRPALRAACAAAGCWLARARQRRDLGKLDDRLLADIGVTRAEAEAERCKPFWR